MRASAIVFVLIGLYCWRPTECGLADIFGWDNLDTGDSGPPMPQLHIWIEDDSTGVTSLGHVEEPVFSTDVEDTFKVD